MTQKRTPHFISRYEQFNKGYLTSDLSPRVYHRWQNDGKSYVLMDCSDLQSLQAFIQVDNLLREYQLSAPEIIETDLDQGFLLLEDFGDETFTKVLEKTPYLEPTLYQDAITVLTHLQERIECYPPFLKEYSFDLGIQKVQQFIDYYVPHLIKNADLLNLKKSFLKAWEKPIKLALNSKKSIFLKDYHVDNLMHLPQRPKPQNVGLLDFQDAIIAPLASDLVSLLEDARRTVPEEIKKSMWKLYLDAHPKGDHEEIYISGIIISAIRHTRIIGLFTKIAKEKGNTKFLQRIPHLWNLLEQCCHIKELQPVQQWLDLYIPKHLRIIPAL